MKLQTSIVIFGVHRLRHRHMSFRERAGGSLGMSEAERLFIPQISMHRP
jgi:hypothetical protein